LLTRAPFALLFCVICVFCFFVVLVRLSVPVQVIDWKVERLISEMTYNVLMGTSNPTHSLTHSLHHRYRFPELLRIWVRKWCRPLTALTYVEHPLSSRWPAIARLSVVLIVSRRLTRNYRDPPAGRVRLMYARAPANLVPVRPAGVGSDPVCRLFSIDAVLPTRDVRPSVTVHGYFRSPSCALSYTTYSMPSDWFNPFSSHSIVN